MRYELDNLSSITISNVYALQDEIPEVPDSSVGQGVLPRLIAGLVNRRRNVKKLMKDRSATKTQLSQVSTCLS